MTIETRLLDSITDLSAADRDTVIVSGSHGGLYPATLASRANLRAVIFNDAGIGLEDAGIAGVRALARVGMAAAAASHMSCRIGSALDAFEYGAISYANEVASRIGIQSGMPVDRAAEILHDAPTATNMLEELSEARWEDVAPGAGIRVLMVDSASLVKPEDGDRIIITGSHGGLIGGDPQRALKAHARLAVFNDAGMGKERIGVSRLPALDQLGIAAVTVAHHSARIGDARSTLETGIVSAANRNAEQFGIRIGLRLSEQIGWRTSNS